MESPSVAAPGDQEIRALLRHRLAIRHRHAAVIEELGLLRHEVRVDVAVVDGQTLHGYEIKSDRDRLDRLGRQVAVYSDVLDRATLVTGPRYQERALGLLPDWWEVLVVRSTGASVRLVRVRPGRLNPARSPRSMVELIWHEHALQILAERNEERGYRGKPRWVLWDRICQLLSTEEIACEVRKVLIQRAGRSSEPRCS